MDWNTSELLEECAALVGGICGSLEEFLDPDAEHNNDWLDLFFAAVDLSEHVMEQIGALRPNLTPEAVSVLDPVLPFLATAACELRLKVRQADQDPDLPENEDNSNDLVEFAEHFQTRHEPGLHRVKVILEHIRTLGMFVQESGATVKTDGAADLAQWMTNGQCAKELFALLRETESPHAPLGGDWHGQKSKITRACQNGELVSTGAGPARRISRESFEAWVDRLSKRELDMDCEFTLKERGTQMER